MSKPCRTGSNPRRRKPGIRRCPWSMPKRSIDRCRRSSMTTKAIPDRDSNVSASTKHAETSAYTFNSLRAAFRERPDDLIAHDLMLLFEEGQPEGHPGAGPDGRPWRRQQGPGVLQDLEGRQGAETLSWEVVSRSTWRRDVQVKPPLYAALGIAEFWLFDPLRARLGGFELVGAEYRAMGRTAGRGIS